MSEKIKLADLTDFDPAEYLDSEEEMAALITTILEENDPQLLAAALGAIARAKGMAQIAQDSGVPMEALYQALCANSEPRFETVARVIRALGLRLVAEPANAADS